MVNLIWLKTTLNIHHLKHKLINNLNVIPKNLRNQQNLCYNLLVDSFYYASACKLPGRCSWSSRPGRPQNHIWRRTAWQTLVLRSQKVSENDNVKGSQEGGLQFSWGDSRWLLDSPTGASLLVVNLALGLLNYESGFYMTPGPRIDQPPLQRTGQGQLSVCSRMTKTEGHGGSDVSVYE